jgi:hypothetical protein
MAGLDQPYKLLLIDNHGSHHTPEFVLFAVYNHVVPMAFLAQEPLVLGNNSTDHSCIKGVRGYDSWYWESFPAATIGTRTSKSVGEVIKFS